MNADNLNMQDLLERHITPNGIAHATGLTLSQVMMALRRCNLPVPFLNNYNAVVVVREMVEQFPTWTLAAISRATGLRSTRVRSIRHQAQLPPPTVAPSPPRAAPPHRFRIIPR